MTRAADDDLVARLEPYLTVRALEHYVTRRYERESDYVGTREELRSLLGSSQSAFVDSLWETEQCWGGVYLDDLLWGVCASLRRGFPPKIVRATNGAEVIAVATYLTAGAHLYLDEDGALYEDAADIGIPPTQIAEAWPTHFERVWLAGRLVDSRPFRLEITADGGARVAELLDIPVFEEASDSHATLWARGDIEVYAPRTDDLHAPKGPRTVVTAAAIEPIAAALLVLHTPNVHTTVQLTRDIRETRLPSGPPTLTIPIKDPPRTPPRELRIYGKQGAFRTWVGAVR